MSMILTRARRATLMAPVYMLLWFGLFAGPICLLPSADESRNHLWIGILRWMHCQRTYTPADPYDISIWPAFIFCSALVSAAAAIPMVSIWRRSVAASRLADRCDRCGYLLRGLTSGVCPECGETNAREFDIALERELESRRRGWPSTLMCSLIGTVWTIVWVIIATRPIFAGMSDYPMGSVLMLPLVIHPLVAVLVFTELFSFRRHAPWGAVRFAWSRLVRVARGGISLATLLAGVAILLVAALGFDASATLESLGTGTARFVALAIGPLLLVYAEVLDPILVRRCMEAAAFDGVCYECNYSLHGLASDRCPECGCAFQPPVNDSCQRSPR